jgi:hypothetical protein
VCSRAAGAGGRAAEACRRNHLPGGPSACTRVDIGLHMLTTILQHALNVCQLLQLQAGHNTECFTRLQVCSHVKQVNHSKQGCYKFESLAVKTLGRYCLTLTFDLLL